jgi:hypothetical protein
MRHGDTREHKQPQTKAQINWRDRLDGWADILLTYNRAQSLSSFVDFWLLTSTYNRFSQVSPTGHEGSVSRFGNVRIPGYSARWAICELNKLAYFMLVVARIFAPFPCWGEAPWALWGLPYFLLCSPRYTQCNALREWITPSAMLCMCSGNNFFSLFLAKLESHVNAKFKLNEIVWL